MKTLSPLTKIVPFVGAISPAKRFKKVVLPAPFGACTYRQPFETLDIQGFIEI
ncbi:hypothetical protein ACIQVU_02435 [Lysinibacillus sp. NPDC098008]|uniref:hypothetical protein n=1 Tax=Lysinibacillus sp. NPDC098008 TaxID=3364146 RepID=UPI0038227CD7